jgi:hypothetical protein
MAVSPLVAPRFPNLVLELLQDGDDGSFGVVLAQPGDHILFHQITNRCVQFLGSGLQHLTVFKFEAASCGYRAGLRLHILAVEEASNFEQEFLFNSARCRDCHCVTTKSQSKTGRAGLPARWAGNLHEGSPLFGQTAFELARAATTGPTIGD